MALNLFAKKLMKRPIGTHVELTVETGASGLENLSGVITDSDFTTSVEITTDKGEEKIIDYSLIKGFQETKSLEEVLKGLETGTRIHFSYGIADAREPNLSGTVTENDGMEAIEIMLPGGRELTLNYAIIRSLLVRHSTPPLLISSAVTRKELLLDKAPEDILNVSDLVLKETFERLPYADRQKLSAVYDRFKYGIKISDRNKQSEAAHQARQILLREDSMDYFWSREAALFCGYLLRRTSVYDADVFLVGEYLEEAAYAAWKAEQHRLAGVCAATALLENTAKTGDMTVILAHSIVKSGDITGLQVFEKKMCDNLKPVFKALIDDACAAAGIPIPMDPAAALTLLADKFPETGMGEELESWFPEVQAPVSTTPVVVDTLTPAEAVPAKPEYSHGVISRVNWSEHTGTITGENGSPYTFGYEDIADEAISKAVSNCMRADLGGEVYAVKFHTDHNKALNILPDNTLVDRARLISADTSRADRFEKAFALCRNAVNTSDIRRALGDLIKLSSAIYTSTRQVEYLKEALALYEKNAACYPVNAFAVMGVAQAYAYLKQYPKMLEHAARAMDFTGLNVKQRITLTSQYVTLLRDWYTVCGDKTLLKKILNAINALTDTYAGSFAADEKVRNLYVCHTLHHRIFAECALEMLSEAQADYARLPDQNSQKETLGQMLEKLRGRMAPKEPKPAETEPAEIRIVESAVKEEDAFAETADEEETEEEIIPYTDNDGWNALKLTKKEVIDYALSISGPSRIPAILAYLRAASGLNSEIAPIYHTVALAANDPMEAPDYSITALVDALAGSDSEYPTLTDCCMGAAFLRTSFLSGRGYDYSAQGLRDSIAISQQLDALRDACNTLEQFRKETGRAIDIYADYRNQAAKKLMEDLNETVRRADDLYTKFIQMPARDGAKFARLVETKKIVFAKDGYLATMLSHIRSRSQDALEAEKEYFVHTYLGGAEQFSRNRISMDAIDSLIVRCWEQAGNGMQMKKQNETLQGSRRNNLRSNISDILGTICQWYAISEQGAGMSWRTEEGVEAYQRLSPLLMEQLRKLCAECTAELESCPDRELATGLFLLAATAQELSARLDGSWKFEQEKYLYADFLRGNSVMLDENFMPELASTFCALPEFNILARIRSHVESEHNTFQQQIDQIYGMDKTRNNYGTAALILRYLEATGNADTVTLPENPERFVMHTGLQTDMRYRSFRETYALATNYGQIIKSDPFCHTLEDTVRYWYASCRETGNYGFLTSIIQQAENQIHACARQYETQLDEQLDALIAGNRQFFEEHPECVDAIRGQIVNQNFTVAEDWMSRIRIGDMSLDIQQPKALGYLHQFLSGYPDIYKNVADARRPLSALLGRRDIHNKDTKCAQQLIDNWLSSGSPSNCGRIEKLVNLLGWPNVTVSQYAFTQDPRTEVYQVRKESITSGLTAPQHPIAAFGSNLDRKRMYVVCLYGIYDCDRLYEKMRQLDVIDGSKIILLDYALGQADRRSLARKLKKRESSLRHVNLLIDRVLISHLADHYNENLINSMLMATAMPFSYCQPYVVESIHTMPPEIFIGRRDELLKIEDPAGVNLIYGGRQLGKSALFKKAVADLDGQQNQRAVLVDINHLDCAGAARRLSEELIDLKIIPDAEVTEDWDELCRNIKRRLRSGEEEISYFLLMLDEADTFIQDCARCGYRPLIALKDIQQSLSGQFKYVLAGLHDIIRFNRQIALGNNSVITHMPSLKITPFRTPEAQELLTQPLSYLGFSLPSKVTVSQILATCNYFPGLIQLYAKKLIESVRAADYAGYDIKKTPPYVVSDEHLRRVMADKEFVEQIQEKFVITLKLDQDQGSCYYPLTLLIGWMYNVMPSKNGYTAKDVLFHARDLGIRPLADLDAEKIDALLTELHDLNILRSVSSDSYLLSSKNFRDLLGSDEEIFEKLMCFGGAAA